MRPGGAEVDVLQRRVEPHREPEGRGRVARAHDHAELLAAEPAHDVGAAQRGAQQVGQPPQHLVARAVSVHVVHPLEIVDVEHEQRHRVVRATRTRELGAQALVEVAVVEEPGERVGLRLLLQPRAGVRVVERQPGGVGERARELELGRGEMRGLADAVDVERALEDAAGDQRHRDERLRLVGGRARHDLGPRVEVRVVGVHRLAPLDGPARDPLAEGGGRAHDLVGPAVACEHRGEQLPLLVGLVEREPVVGHEIEQRVGDPVQHRVERLLGEHVVEDLRQAPVQLNEPVRGGASGSAVGCSRLAERGSAAAKRCRHQP